MTKFKILWLWLASILLTLNLYTKAQEEDLLGWLESAVNIEFGYTETQTITIDSINTNKVTLASPVVIDDFSDKVDEYRVVYNTMSIEETIFDAMEDVNILDEIWDKEIKVDDIESKSSFKFDLEKNWDNLDPNKIYYVSIFPISASRVGEPSKEVCFRLSDSFKWVWSACSTASTTTTTTHQSAPDLDLAHITPRVDWKQITITWTAISWVEKLEISLRDHEKEWYNTLATVGMNTEKYTFNADKNWEYLIRFVGINWTTKLQWDLIHNVTVNSISTTPTTPTPTTSTTPTTWIWKVPVVWPEKNIAIIVISTLVLYFVYRKLYRKS